MSIFFSYRIIRLKDFFFRLPYQIPYEKKKSTHMSFNKLERKTK